jgi:large subunit ribosomal protein L1
MSTNPTGTKKGSKKYRANLEKIKTKLAETGTKTLSVEEAVNLLFDFDQPNFKDGPTVELHAKLNINPTKSDQLVRGSVVMPHGTGKKVKIAAFVTPQNVERAKKAGAELVGGEELIEEIKNTSKIDFDIAIAEPEMMKKLPPIARILGTAKVMPNPRTGTVGENIEEMIQTIQAGKVDYRNDKTGNVHIICGKINSGFDSAKILENVQAAINSLEKVKPEAVKKKYILSLHLASSLSPSIQIG